jgi:stalled ribosome rescue protein Dom34
MKTTKQLGVWMDYSIAHLMELANNSIGITTIFSQSKHREAKQDFRKDEGLMHNIEQDQNADYFKRLSEIIRGYDAVLLFGPSDAKSELFNILSENHLFDKIKIEVKPADKMTENQRNSFVKDYFNSYAS